MSTPNFTIPTNRPSPKHAMVSFDGQTVEAARNAAAILTSKGYDVLEVDRAQEHPFTRLARSGTHMAEIVGDEHCDEPQNAKILHDFAANFLAALQVNGIVPLFKADITVLPEVADKLNARPEPAVGIVTLDRLSESPRLLNSDFSTLIVPIDDAHRGALLDQWAAVRLAVPIEPDVAYLQAIVDMVECRRAGMRCPPMVVFSPPETPTYSAAMRSVLKHVLPSSRFVQCETIAGVIKAVGSFSQSMRAHL